MSAPLFALLGCNLPGPASAVSSQEGKAWLAGEGDRNGNGAGPLVLEPPPLPDPSPEQTPPALDPDIRTALAYQFNAPIYGQPDGRSIVGIVRRGGRLPVARWVSGSGCEGSWYELQGGGYVCNRLGFNPTPGAPDLPPDIATRRPALERPLPFEYAKIAEPDTPLYWRVPTPEEQAAAEASSTTASPVKLRSKGDTFIALDRVEAREDGVRFVRTVRGLYLLEEAILRKSPPTMQGEALEGADGLPLAFAWKDTPLLAPDSREPVGTALKYSRFPIEGEETVEGVAYAVTPHGWVLREDVRVARVVPRPDKIGAHEQWIHVDLSEQVLVAYEGDEPVRATLVSSGKEGYDTPAGTFQVVKKYATKTMSGDDPREGYYEVDQVPWIMYYWGSLALHGAYWHDGFGQVRSHGCTNIPPLDAQWLFRWAEPSLPAGWHGQVSIEGPWVHLTRDP